MELSITFHLTCLALFVIHQQGLLLNAVKDIVDILVVISAHSVACGKESHLAHSPFRVLPIGTVSQFPLDYKRLVCFWVMKRLIWLWMHGPLTNNCRIGIRAVQVISDSLTDLKNHLPREFNRKERWKATQFWPFFLYTGLVVLKSHLARKMLEYYFKCPLNFLLSQT